MFRVYGLGDESRLTMSGHSRGSSFLSTCMNAREAGPRGENAGPPNASGHSPWTNREEEASGVRVGDWCEAIHILRVSVGACCEARRARLASGGLL